MERECVVLTVDAAHEGEVYTASYFIEYGLIHCEIGGRYVVVPLGNVSAEGTVRALLSGHLLQKERKAGNARKWADKASRGPPDWQSLGAA